MATKKQKEAGRKSQKEGTNFENILEESYNRDTTSSRFKILDEPRSVTAVIGKTAINKNDKSISDSESEAPDEGISIKNSADNETQMQTITRNRFLDLLELTRPVPQEVKDFCSLFFGSDIQDRKENDRDFREICNRLGVDYDALDWESERRRGRACWDSIPEPLRNAALEYFNDELVFERILEIALKTGNTPLHGSEYMVWCDASIAGKSNIENLLAHRTDALIESIVKSGYRFAPNYHQGRASTLHAGPFVVQMKGSGKWKDYHNIQFKMKLRKMLAFCPDVPTVRGDYLDVFPAMTELPKSNRVNVYQP